MCGLVGIAGDLRFQDEFTMKRLLLADYFRGPDSTGMAAVRTDGTAIIAKIASNPIDLFGTESFKKALNGNASRVFLGHNRLKTRGDISTVNSHPFQFDHIVGAHNGTLEYASWKALEKEIGEEHAVDSMALISAIAKLGIVDTIKLCIEGKDCQSGAWAITWVDKDKGTLNFLRNKHRPLHYAFEAPKEKKEKGYRRMFWASEWWMMREAIQSSAQGYGIHVDKDNVGFFSFKPDTWYAFDLEELCAEKTKPVKPKVKEVKGKPFVEYKPAHNYGSQRDDPFGRDTPPNISGFQRATVGTPTGTATNPNSHRRTECMQTVPNSTTTPRGKDKKKTVMLLRGDDTHPYAGLISEENFLSITQHGCFFCGKEVSYGDPGVTVFERDGNVLCRDCSDHPKDMENPPVRVYVRATAFDVVAN